MSELTYQGYNKQSWAVMGDREKYSTILKTIGGRWNSRLKGMPPGWLVPRAKEHELKKLIDGINGAVVKADEKDVEIEKIQTQAKSRKEQHKYHRAVSASEDSEDVQSETKAEEVKEEKSVSVHSDVKPVQHESESGSDESESESPQKPKHRPKQSTEEEALTQKREQAKRQFEEEKRAHERRLVDSQKHKKEHRHVNKDSREHRHVEKDVKEHRHADRERRHTEKDVKEHRHVDKEHRHTEKDIKEHRHNRSPDFRDRKKDVKYYESFAKKPSKFRALYEPSDDERYSSSSGSSSSSSDDFPLPESPKRQSHRKDPEDYGQLFHKVRGLQKKLYEMDLKQRKDKDRKKRTS